MRKITIYTGLYAEQLHNLIPNAATAYNLEEICFCLTVDKNTKTLLLRALAELIQNLTLAENPVVKSSESLRIAVKRIIFPKQTVLKELRRFFAENDSLHLDGYLQFAMRNYSERINVLLYRTVKKNFHKIYNLSVTP